jgi:hypothetical protein
MDAGCCCHTHRLPPAPPFFFQPTRPELRHTLIIRLFPTPPSHPHNTLSSLHHPPLFQNNNSTDKEKGGSSAGALSLRTTPAWPLILATSRRSQNNIVILLRKKQSYITFARVVPESVSSSRSASHLYQTPHGPLILRGPFPALADARRSTAPFAPRPRPRRPLLII